jgi:hypothetical protein
MKILQFEERLVDELNNIIENDRYPLSPADTHPARHTRQTPRRPSGTATLAAASHRQTTALDHADVLDPDGDRLNLHDLVHSYARLMLANWV